MWKDLFVQTAENQSLGPFYCDDCQILFLGFPECWLELAALSPRLKHPSTFTTDDLHRGTTPVVDWEYFKQFYRFWRIYKKRTRHLETSPCC